MAAGEPTHRPVPVYPAFGVFQVNLGAARIAPSHGPPVRIRAGPAFCILSNVALEKPGEIVTRMRWRATAVGLADTFVDF